MATNSPHSEQSQQSHAAMAPSAAPAAQNGQKGITKLAINSLMSPPDPPLDSFSINHQSDLGKPAAANDHPMPMSPPISPYSKVVSTTEAPATPPGQAINDPVLYPSEEGSPSPASPSQAPLFAPAELEEHQSLVDSHVRSRSPTSFAQVAPPNREEYELVLHFQSRVAELYEANPLRWLRRERAILMADRKRARTYQNIMPATKPIASKPQRTHRADRVSKPAPAPRPIRTHPNATATVPMRPAARRVSSTPEPSRRVVAPNREDKDFKTIQDFCPPLDSLPNKPNSLKVDWKGQPIDLSRDPYALLLHPDELSLAGNLRLDCATYLTSKRRIFERRLQCLRNGKEFRKTDAQQACKIDVNKASKLWTAFEKVGWLDTKWMRRFH